jgi:hypothetical protein
MQAGKGPSHHGLADLCSLLDIRMSHILIASLLSNRRVAPQPPLTEFSTEFTATESPISEGGIWLNGQSDGLDWLNFKTLNGIACAAAFSAEPPPPYNDSIAILKSSAFACAPDQFAEIVVSRAGGYSPSVTHECGMFVRFALSANSASGYEAYLNHASNFTIVRWNGALNNFSPLSSTGPGPTSPVDGDVLRFEVEGSTLRYYQNDVLVATATDSTFSSGQAGLQSYCVSGATLASYGMKSFRCGNL